MEIRSLDDATPFVTTDGSTIRSLLDHSNAPVVNQSLAEATLDPGQATVRHHHRVSEEIYYLTAGSGEMEIDGRRAPVSAGDAVLIPPGAWHQITATGAEPLRLLCACAPPWSAEDTYFD
jgi:mannose-6-phosphate isomerase-like protein (cupin superfamily)